MSCTSRNEPSCGTVCTHAAPYIVPGRCCPEMSRTCAPLPSSSGYSAMIPVCGLNACPSNPCLSADRWLEANVRCSTVTWFTIPCMQSSPLLPPPPAAPARHTQPSATTRRRSRIYARLSACSAHWRKPCTTLHWTLDDVSCATAVKEWGVGGYRVPSGGRRVCAPVAHEA